jgi:hypothetical protein
MPRSTVRSYKLNALTLSVDAPNSALCNWLDWLLGPLAFEGTDFVAQWQVQTRSADILPEVEARHVIWAGEFSEERPAVIWRDGMRGGLLVRDHVAVSINRRNKKIGVQVRRMHEDTLADTAAVFVVNEIIRASGHFLVHAACLLDPIMDDCLLIFAPSGTGKTTTALALARSGWRLLGDDATVIQRSGDEITAWGLPRALNIHRSTETLLPWIGAATTDWGSRDVQSVALCDISRLVSHARHAPQPCRTVLLLDPPNGSTHSFAPFDRGEALTHILADNLRIMPSGMDDSDLDLLDCLTDLMKHTTVLRLSAGSQLDTLAASLAACLKSEKRDQARAS